MPVCNFKCGEDQSCAVKEGSGCFRDGMESESLLGDNWVVLIALPGRCGDCEKHVG